MHKGILRLKIKEYSTTVLIISLQACAKLTKVSGMIYWGGHNKLGTAPLVSGEVGEGCSLPCQLGQDRIKFVWGEWMGLFGGWDLVLELCGPIVKNFWFYLKKKFTISRHKATPNRALSHLCNSGNGVSPALLRHTINNCTVYCYRYLFTLLERIIHRVLFQYTFSADLAYVYPANFISPVFVRSVGAFLLWCPTYI